MAKHARPKVKGTYGTTILVDGKPKRAMVTRLEDGPVTTIKGRPMKGKVKIKSTVQGYEQDPLAHLRAMARGETPHAIHHAHLD